MQNIGGVGGEVVIQTDLKRFERQKIPRGRGEACKSRQDSEAPANGCVRGWWLAEKKGCGLALKAGLIAVKGQ